MEFKGTKGEWYHEKGKSNSIFHPSKIGSIICSVSETFTQGKTEINDEYKYNALLISKAPELLEMLVRIYEVMPEAGDLKQLIKESTEL